MLPRYFEQASRFSADARRFLAAQALYGFGQTAVWVLRNLHLKANGFDEAFIGSTLAVQSVGMVGVVLVAPRWMDRLRLRPFQVVGALLLAAGLAGVAFRLPPGLVLAACFLSGLGMALLEAASAPFLVRHSTAVERPWLFGVSMALSPAVGLLATLSIKGGTLAWGEGTTAYARLLLGAAGLTLASIPILARLAGVPPEKGADGAPEGPLDARTALRFFLPELLFGLGAGLTIPFINLYFRNRFGVPVGTIAVYYAGAQALMMGAFLLAPVLAQRFGAVRTIVAFQLSSIPFFAVLAFTTSLEAAVATFLLRHACMNMVHPVGAHFAMEVVRPGQRVRINGVKQAANKIAWVISNSAGGVLLAHGAILPFFVDGFTTIMMATIAFYVSGSLLYWRFFSREPEPRLGTAEPE